MMVYIPRKKMLQWRRMENEHTTNTKRQEAIVRQHIREHGIGYYPALIKMERRLDKKRR
jgi:hypothetical protein